MAAPAARAGPSPCPCDRHPGRLGPRRPGGPGPEGAAAGGTRRGPAHGAPPGSISRGLRPSRPGWGWGWGCPGRPAALKARGAGAHGRRGRPGRAALGSGAAARGARAFGAAPRRALPPPPPLPPRTAWPAPGGGRGRGRGQGRWLGFPGTGAAPAQGGGREERRWLGCRGHSAPGDHSGAPLGKPGPQDLPSPRAPFWDKRHSAPDASIRGLQRPKLC